MGGFNSSAMPELDLGKRSPSQFYEDNPDALEGLQKPENPPEFAGQPVNPFADLLQPVAPNPGAWGRSGEDDDKPELLREQKANSSLATFAPEATADNLPKLNATKLGGSGAALVDSLAPQEGDNWLARAANELLPKGANGKPIRPIWQQTHTVNEAGAQEHDNLAKLLSQANDFSAMVPTLGRAISDYGDQGRGDVSDVLGRLGALDTGKTQRLQGDLVDAFGETLPFRIAPLGAGFDGKAPAPKAPTPLTWPGDINPYAELGHSIDEEGMLAHEHMADAWAGQSNFGDVPNDLARTIREYGDQGRGDVSDLLTRLHGRDADSAAYLQTALFKASDEKIPYAVGANNTVAGDEPKPGQQPDPESPDPEGPNPEEPDPEEPDPEEPDPEEPKKPEECQALLDEINGLQDDSDQVKAELDTAQQSLDELEQEIEQVRQEIADAEQLAMEEGKKGWEESDIGKAPTGWGYQWNPLRRLRQWRGALEQSNSSMEYLHNVLYPRRSELEQQKQGIASYVGELQARYDEISGQANELMDEYSNGGCGADG
ncbi:MAG: hypothetical protein HYU60_01130 [Magnetospirillum sp.]|nr:hypothetical protein [Magnetospirillum sp.]